MHGMTLDTASLAAAFQSSSPARKKQPEECRSLPSILYLLLEYSPNPAVSIMYEALFEAQEPSSGSVRLVLIIIEQEMSMGMQTKPTENTGYGFLQLRFPKADTNLRYTCRVMTRQAGPVLKIFSSC